MNSFNVRFAGLAVLVLGCAFAIHLLLLWHFNYPLFENRIILSYIANVVLAIVIVTILNHFREKYKHQIGFLFLAGSALKFIVFFVFFYPFYTADDNLSKAEFVAFFVPYGLSLILETTTLSKLLNKLDTDKP